MIQLLYIYLHGLEEVTVEHQLESLKKIPNISVYCVIEEHIIYYCIIMQQLKGSNLIVNMVQGSYTFQSLTRCFDIIYHEIHTYNMPLSPHKIACGLVIFIKKCQVGRSIITLMEQSTMTESIKVVMRSILVCHYAICANCL